MTRMRRSLAALALTCCAVVAGFGGEGGCAGTPAEQKAAVQAQLDQARATLVSERQSQETAKAAADEAARKAREEQQAKLAAAKASELAALEARAHQQLDLALAKEKEAATLQAAAQKQLELAAARDKESAAAGKQLERVAALEQKQAELQKVADAAFAKVAAGGQVDPGGALTAVGDLIPGPAGLIWKLALPIGVALVQEFRLRNQTSGLRADLASYVKGIDVLSTSNPVLNAGLNENWAMVRSEMTPAARAFEDAHAQT